MCRIGGVSEGTSSSRAGLGSSGSAVGGGASPQGDVGALGGGEGNPLLQGVLRRLHKDWNEAALAIKLRANSSYSDIARKLSVDRGTAQRLLRLLRTSEVDTVDLQHFPGVRAWTSVLNGLEGLIGESHDKFQRLSLAVDQFGKSLRDSGGSKQAVIRDLRKGPGAEVAAGGGGAGVAVEVQGGVGGAGFTGDKSDARSRWVVAAADMVGYCIDYRLHMQFLRRNPEHPSRVDLATMDGFKGCRGVSNAAPFVIGRFAIGSSTQLEDLEKPAEGRAFQILDSLTTKPIPAVLSIGGTQRQTILIEFPWDAMTNPVDLAVLNNEPSAAGDNEAETPEDWVELSLVHRHPSRNLILDRVVPASFEKDFNVTFRAYRTNIDSAPGGPWYDRMDETATLERLGSVVEAIDKGPEPFAGYRAVAQETLKRLGWGMEELILYRVHVRDPMPFAKYAIIFEKTPGD